MTAEEFRQRLAALAQRTIFAGLPTGRLDDLPAGWLGLLETLVAGIEALPEGNAVRCDDIKEKVGVLRIALESCPAPIASRVQQLIEQVCEASAQTCCACGGPGRVVRPHGWYLCLCADHQDLPRDQLRAVVHPAG
jgi:hypothetical protein